MRFRSAIAALVLACCTLGVCVSAFAQNSKPDSDLFLGYTYAKPDIAGWSPQLPAGGGGTLTFNVTPKLGFSVDLNYSQQTGNATGNYKNSTVMVGPRYFLRPLRDERFRPFIEALGGVNHVNFGTFSSGGVAVGFGGGLDVKIAKHIDFRIFRLDGLYQHLKDGDDMGIRAQTGLVFRIGSSEPEKIPAAACTLSPTEVMAGEPITATASPSQFNPKRTLTYAWTTTGGKTSGAAATTQVDTAGLAPGSYRVASHVTDGKKGMADCSQNFIVKEPPKHPPTISCSADRSTVMSGQNAAIHCTGNSEDRRPLSYAWQSTAGNIAGNGTDAVLGTSGVTGPVTVATTVTDDRGLSANTSTGVTVQAPPPPPPPPPPTAGSAEAIRQDLMNKGRALLNVHFDTAKATIRPESEPLLGNAAQVLKDDPSLFIYVDGHTDSVGKKPYNLALSARRAASVRMWLEKNGVPASRMSARGFGMENPVGDNTSEAGRQANRRVELVRMTDAEKAKAEAAPKATPRKVVHKRAAATATTTTTTPKAATKK